jgi:hypothetical protein
VIKLWDLIDPVSVNSDLRLSLKNPAENDVLVSSGYYRICEGSRLF